MRKHLRLLSLLLSGVLLFNSAAPAIAAGLQYRVPLKVNIRTADDGTQPGTSQPGTTEPGTTDPGTGATTPGTPEPGTESLALTPKSVSLNTTVGRAVTGLVSIENTGTSSVTLGTAKVSGSTELATSTACDGKVLAPAANCAILVTFAATKQGTATGSLSISGQSAGITAVATSDTSSSTVYSVTSDTTTMTPSGAYAATFSAVLYDAYGNLAPAGVSVAWTSDLGSLSRSTSVTDAQGVATTSLRSSTVGVATVSALGPSGAKKSATINVATDPSVSRVASISASPRSGILADNASYSTVTAVVKDSTGAVAGPGLLVRWVTNKGTLSAATSYTNAKGEASVQLRSSSTGTASVSATGPSGTALNTLVSFVADIASARIVSWAPSAPYASANGSGQTSLVVKILDGYGNVVPAQSLKYSTTFGTLSTLTGKTSATTGEASLTIKSSALGVAEVLVTMESTGEMMALQVEFVSPPETTTIDSFTVSADRIPADGKSTVTVRARVVGPDGKPYTYGLAAVYWNVVTGSGTMATPTYADSEGYATSTFKASIYAGAGRLRAMNHAKAVASALYLDINIVGDVTTGVVYQVGSSTSPKANGVATSTITVIARDAYNNPPEGLTVYLSSTIGTLKDTVVVTGADGRATTTITSTQTGTGQIYAQADKGDAKYGNITFTKP